MRNPYKRLIGLLPTFPLMVGTVTSVDGEIATVTLPGGFVLKARGEATVGQRVFVRNGVIEGQAPALTQESIEVG